MAEPDPPPNPLDSATYALLENSVRDLRIIKEFAELMLGHRGDIREVLWDVAQHAMARLGLEDCVVYLLDERRGDLEQCAAFGPKNPAGREILNPIRIRLGEGIVGSVAVGGHIEMIDDCSLDARYIHDDQQRLAELAVPILNEGRVIGVIDSEHSRRGFFTAWHRDLFVAIAALAAGRIMAAIASNVRRRLSTHDGLTDLLNRGELLRQVQQRLNLDNSAAAAIFLDLDRFSLFNDTLGHVVGDAVLQSVAQRIRAMVPPGAIAGRFGGDEFVVLLSGDEAEGVATAERIVNEIGDRFDSGVMAGFQISCSAGVAARIEGDLAMGLINRADRAMYLAKQEGGGRACVYDSQLASRLRREQTLIFGVARAADTEDPALQVHLQPVFVVPDQTWVAVEALARWEHPQLGVVPPSEFIVIAERTGKIQSLGYRLHRLALQSLRDLQTEGRPELLLQINVSPLQLRLADFAPRLIELAQEFAIGPHQLACEITETALIGADERSAATLQSLALRGVRLILDDFGTGYASLSTLTRFPFDGVKIDRRFVHDLATNPAARAIVRSVVSLSRDLGITCTAEGVEQPADLRELVELGCTLAQGDWLCPAMSRRDLAVRLRPS